MARKQTENDQTPIEEVEKIMEGKDAVQVLANELTAEEVNPHGIRHIQLAWSNETQLRYVESVIDGYLNDRYTLMHVQQTFFDKNLSLHQMLYILVR